MLFTYLVMRKFYTVIKRVYRTTKPCLIALLVLLMIIYSIYWKFIKEDLVYYPEVHILRRQQESRLREMLALDSGSGCTMPKLDPFAPELMQFHKNVTKIVCEGVDWVDCDMSECRVKKDILQRMNNIVCKYKDIVFVTDNYLYKTSPTTVYEDGVYKLNKSDYVKVSCAGTDVNGLGIFSNRWSGFKAGIRPVQKDPPNNPNAINVMIILFDSVSRNGFIRKLPRSYKVITEELEAVILKSYNIVGDGTASALIPILTGRTVFETPDWRRSLNNTNKIDLGHFIFHLLRKQGTAFYEDRPLIGTFQYSLNGFNQQPTDHYLRPFFLEESKRGVKLWMGLKKRHCVGDTPQHVFMMNLTSQFFKQDGKKFGITFSSGLSHDDLNLVSAADDDLVDFLRRYKNEGMMEDTMLFVMSDHGPRFSFIRSTNQGRLEERMPMVSIVLPKKLKDQRPQALDNLRANANVLTTPFDMHTTLLDVFGLLEHRNKYKVPGSDLERGMSFLEPLPSRSCSVAGVVVHWCACSHWAKVAPDHPASIDAAMALANYIDRLTAHRRSQCATRHLISIEWVMQLVPYDRLLELNRQNRTEIVMEKQRPEQEYYQAKIIMSPKDAVYEGSMLYNVAKDTFEISVADISRTNAYGNEPSCISKTEPHLNKFCYCNNMLSFNRY